MNNTRHHLAEVIAEKTLHIKDRELLVKEVAAYLLHEKQTEGFESLIRDIMQYRADKGYIEAVAVSAHPLTEQVIKDIEQLLQNEFPGAKGVVVSQKIDSDVVGGLRIDLANEQLDLSVKAKLNTFKRLTALERN